MSFRRHCTWLFFLFFFRRTLLWFFFVWRLLGNIAQSFYLCNVVPRVLRQHWTEFYHVQYSLEPLWQHCTKFLPVQCCPKSINTTFSRIFSCAMLSGSSCTTLHKVFSVTCNVVPRELRKHRTGFLLCNVV